ncbi:MAG: MFS transporter, partial [Nocardioides sp.]
MLDTYRRILVVPGARLFSAAGMVARLPISMVGLGIVLLVEHATGSYGLAGAVSAVYVAAGAAFTILQGRLLDRLGQARVLVPVVAVFATAVALLVVSEQADWPGASTYLFAAVGGATLPAAGSCVRARWSHALTGRPADLQTAFALEAVVDESVFILGPILVTVLATAIHPVAGLGTAVAAGLAGTLLLAA